MLASALLDRDALLGRPRRRGTLHDGFDSQEGADDIALYEGFLAGATAANRRGLWLSGDGIMEDGAINSDDGTLLYPFLTETFGADLVSRDYKVYSGPSATTVGLLPLAAWAHPGRIYGLDTPVHDPPRRPLPVVPTVDGAAAAAQYQVLGPGTGVHRLGLPPDHGGTAANTAP